MAYTCTYIGVMKPISPDITFSNVLPGSVYTHSSLYCSICGNASNQSVVLRSVEVIEGYDGDRELGSVDAHICKDCLEMLLEKSKE